MRTYTSQTLNYNDNLYVGPYGTLTVDYDLLLRVHDNVTPGGHVFNLYDDSNVAVYLAGNITVGNMIVDGDTRSVDLTTGTIVLPDVGGIGVGGNINIGGSFYAAGTITSGAIAIVNAVVANTSVYSEAVTVNSLTQSDTLVANTSVTTPLVSITNGMAQFTAEQTIDNTIVETIIDSFPTSTYRSVNYFAQVTDLDNSYYHTACITVVQDGQNAYKSEYNIVAPEGRLGNFNTNVSEGSCTLSFTAFYATNKVVNVLRTGIAV